MFKKIHSNRNPNATLGSEIRKEFATYLNKAEDKAAVFIKKYPRQIFIGMILTMVISMLFFFAQAPSTVKKPLIIPTISIPKMQNGIGFTDGVDKIQELMKLEKALQVVLEKRVLNANDSLFIEQAIARIETIEKSLKQ